MELIHPITLPLDQQQWPLGKTHTVLSTFLVTRDGPFAPTVATLGNPPHANPDLALSAVFLVLFVVAGGSHLAVLILNQNQGRLFVFSGLVFLFCLIRIASCCLRIGWVYDADNISLTIAAQLLVNVGTAILFVTNNWFTQRVMRARHPHIGWSKPFDVFMTKITELIIISCVVILVTVGVHQFYTQKPQVQQVDHILMTVCLTIFAVLAFIPLPICMVMLAMRKRTYIDKFGTGRYRTKVIMLMISSTLLTLESSFRAGVLYLPPTPINSPQPWYLSDAPFYCFGLLIEITIVATYLVLRVDKRFYVPEKVFGPAAYSGNALTEPSKLPNEAVTRYSTDQQSIFIAARVASIMTASARNSLDIESRPATARRLSGLDSDSRPATARRLSGLDQPRPQPQAPPRRSLEVVPWPDPSPGYIDTSEEASLIPPPVPVHVHMRTRSDETPDRRPTIKAVTSTQLKTRPSPSDGRVSFPELTRPRINTQSQVPPARPKAPNHSAAHRERGRQNTTQSPPRSSGARSESQTRSLRPVYMYQHGFQPPGMTTPHTMKRATHQETMEQVRKQRLKAEHEQQVQRQQDEAQQRRPRGPTQAPVRPQPQPLQQPGIAVGFNDPVYDLPSTYIRRGP